MKRWLTLGLCLAAGVAGAVTPTTPSNGDMASAEIMYAQLKQNGDEIPAWLNDMINPNYPAGGARVGGETMATATSITFTPGGTYQDIGATTVGSVNDYDSNMPGYYCQQGSYFASSFGAGDVFYTFTLPDAYTVAVDVCGGGSWDSSLGILNSSGLIVAENDDNGTVCTSATLKSAIPACCLAAGTYYIVVDGYGSATGPYDLNLSFGAATCVVPVVPCDTYAANLVSLTAPGTVAGSTTGDPHVYGGTGGDQGILVTLPHSGTWNFDLCSAGTTYAADIYLFDGNPCLGGALLASATTNTCATSGSATLLNVDLSAGTYHVLVGNASTLVGDFSLTVSESAARPTSGGPDSFGYAWVNSVNPSGPTYSYVDISGIGTQITLATGSSYAGPLPLGMTFPFYESTFTQFYMSAEGFLSFNALTSNYSTNATMPAVAVPNNVIAGFWDDLSFVTGVGKAYYYFDAGNNRFILQYKNFYKSTVPYPVNFEIILEADGDIFVQFQNMPDAALNSATCGIEDGAGTRGVLVNFNNVGGGLWDGTAVKITRPIGDVVPPAIVHTPLGNSEDTVNPYTVTATITDLDHAVASATLYYQLNGGGGYTPVVMALGAPNTYSGDIPAQAAGTDVQYYISATDTAVPSNTGSTSVYTFSVVDYTIPPTGFTASDGVLDQVNLAWTAPAWAVALFGQPAPEPVFEDYLPLHSSKDAAWQAYQADRAAWQQDAQRAFLNYNVYRDGSLIGTSNTTTYTDLPPTTSTYTYHVTAQFTSRESDPSNTDTGFKTARPTSGGPDALGYTWINSVDAEGPEYEWIDISGTGTALTLTDDSFSAALPLGFNFPFYGANQTSVYVSSNGHLTFGTGSSSLGNTNLPNTGTPNNLIAAFWDDLNPALAGSSVRYLADGANNRFIVQYHVPAFGAASPYTFFDFQVILTLDGNIVVNLSNVDEADVSQATLGIENATGTVGLAANFDGTGGRLADGVAYLFIAPEGDWTGPVIAHTPLTNTEDATNPYPVNANITDADSQVASATLWYQVNGGGYTSVAMTAGTPPAYSAAIPAQAGGSDVQYYIVAVDNSMNSNTTTSPTWSFSVVDYTLAPTGLVASDGGYGDVDITWTAPAWAVALSALQPDFEDYLPRYSSKQEAWTAFQADLTAWQSERSFLTYNVYRDGGLIGTSNTTSYTDVPPVQNQVYTYHVTALFDAGESNPSNSDTGFFAARPTNGGPDAFGYTWMNSDDPSGAVTYSWTDISSAPGAVSYTLTDDSAALLVLPFQIPFYGVDHDSIYVGSNGILGFGASITTYTNGAIPTAGLPDNFYAPFWDDLNPSTGGTIHSLTDAINGKVTVQFTGIFHYGTTTLPYTFQYVLQSDGQLFVYYNDMQGQLDNASVGIENLGGTVGLQANFNDVGSRLTNGLALRIRPFIPCGTPSNVDVAISSGNATISWDAVDGALSYTVFAAGEPYGSFTQIGTSATPSFTDVGAQAAGRKFYQIVAVCE